MEILNVENLHKSFGKTEVLKGVNFSVNKGEVLVILGSSGGGKTTLLRCLTFLEKPEKGKISVNGKTIFDGSNSDKLSKKEQRLRQLNFGLVFQQFNLFPQYNLLENVTLAMKIAAKERADYKENKKVILNEIDAKAKAIIKKVGLSDKENHYPCELSGGQQQRVAIARALALDPAILCFDEPTSALDPELTGEVLKVIKSLKDNDTTMIIVTHEIEFAKNIADKIIFVDNGIIIEEGTAEIIENPQNGRIKTFLSNFANS